MKALVLEGGGAKGAYQVGVWQALKEKGETFDIVTGTSIGALNGALFAQGDFDLAYSLWSNISPEQVIAGDAELLDKLVNMDVNPKNFAQLMRYLRKVIGEKGLDISPFETLLKANIDEERVRNSRVKLGIVTVAMSRNISEVKPLEITVDQMPPGSLHQYLMASSNLPVFKLSHVKGQLYIDGGFYDNLPVNLALSMGATHITTVEIGGIGVKRVPKDVQRRAIVPKVDLGPVLGMSAAQARRNLELGYYDGLKVLDGLMGNHYYVSNNLDSDQFLHQLMHLDPLALSELAAIMGVEGMDPRRFTFEKLMPKVIELTGLGPGASYPHVLIGLLEAVGDDIGLNRFKVRTATDFLSEVQHHYQSGAAPVLSDQIKLLDKLLMQTAVLGQSQRMALLRTVYEKLLLPILTTN